MSIATRFPRTDLQVTLDGVTISLAFALGGWAAFKPAARRSMVMGDLVLLETEINPVMAKLIQNGPRSLPSTITCCGRRPRPSTCTSVATAIR